MQGRQCACSRSLWAVLFQTWFVQFCTLFLSPESLCFCVISLSWMCYQQGKMWVSAGWCCPHLPVPSRKFNKGLFAVLSLRCYGITWMGGYCWDIVKKWRCRWAFWQCSSTMPKQSSRTLLPPGMFVSGWVSISNGSWHHRGECLKVLSG